jgi:hypothetical protein
MSATTMKIRVVTKAKTRSSGPMCPWLVDYPESPAS